MNFAEDWHECLSLKLKNMEDPNRNTRTNYVVEQLYETLAFA